MSANLLKRLLVALWGIPFVIICAYFGGWIFTLVISSISFIAAFEIERMVNKQKPSKIRWLCTAIAAAIPIIAHFGDSSLIFIVLISGILISGIVSLKYVPKEGITRLMETVFISTFVGIPFASVILIRDAAVWETNLIGGMLIIYIFAGVWIADTGAYTIGRLYGKRLMAPVLSPKKTIEGLFGGIISALLWSNIAGLLLGDYLSLLDRIVIGVIIGVMSVLGDLVESLVKRSAETKDSGHFFPGHGGMYDRFDSQMFVFPAIYLYFIAKGIIAFV